MNKVLGGLEKGLIFVISAPAGTGKTTLVRMLQKEFDCIAESISYTTRKARKSEISGRDYHYISEEAFKRKVEDGEFLEHALVFGSYYGTSGKELEIQINAGKHVVLVIDTQGAMQLMQSLEAIFIFISPPNLDVLKERLTTRKSESVEAIEERLLWAKKEIACSGKYNYHIVNDRLETTYDVLRSIFIAEEHKNH